MKKYDVIIVGAGPAGIFTTYELVENSKKKVLLIWSFLRVRMRASIFWSVTAWVCEILPSCVCLVLSKETGVCVRFYVCVCVWSWSSIAAKSSHTLSSRVPCLSLSPPMSLFSIMQSVAMATHI